MSKKSGYKTTGEKKTSEGATTNEAGGTRNHELTPWERAAMERMEVADLPIRLTFTEAEEPAPDHPDSKVAWAVIMQQLGTVNIDFARGLIGQLCASSEAAGGEVDQAKFNYLFAIVTGFKPKGESEALLSAERAIVHAAVSREARRLFTMDSKVLGSAEARLQVEQMFVSNICKLVRASVALGDAIMRHRAGGVSVQNLIVGEGGQAIVGSVTQPERPPSEILQSSPPARSQAAPMPQVERPASAAVPLGRKARKPNGHARP